MHKAKARAKARQSVRSRFRTDVQEQTRLLIESGLVEEDAAKMAVILIRSVRSAAATRFVGKFMPPGPKFE
jgi:hypothetical protein